MSFNIAHLFAQTSTDLTTTEPNVQPITDAEVEAASGVIAGVGIFMLIVLIWAAVNFIIFLFAIIHLVKNPDVKDRMLWILLSIFIPFAAWIYVFGPRRSYNKGKGGSPAPQQTPATPSPNPAQPPASQWQNPSVPAATGAAAASPTVAQAPDIAPEPVETVATPQPSISDPLDSDQVTSAPQDQSNAFGVSADDTDQSPSTSDFSTPDLSQPEDNSTQSIDDTPSDDQPVFPTAPEAPTPGVQEPPQIPSQDQDNNPFPPSNQV